MASLRSRYPQERRSHQPIGLNAWSSLGFGCGDEITDIRVRHIAIATGATLATAHGDHTRGSRGDHGSAGRAAVEATRFPGGRRWPERIRAASSPLQLGGSRSVANRTRTRGRTKQQPASSLPSVPEFINVGEFGRNSRLRKRGEPPPRRARLIPVPAAATQRADRSISRSRSTRPAGPRRSGAARNRHGRQAQLLTVPHAEQGLSRPQLGRRCR